MTLLYQQFSNMLISQRDMCGPRRGTLSNGMYIHSEQRLKHADLCWGDFIIICLEDFLLIIDQLNLVTIYGDRLVWAYLLASKKLWNREYRNFLLFTPISFLVDLLISTKNRTMFSFRFRTRALLVVWVEYFEILGTLIRTCIYDGRKRKRSDCNPPRYIQ
jgi:hypothetical protein